MNMDAPTSPSTGDLKWQRPFTQEELNSITLDLLVHYLNNHDMPQYTKDELFTRIKLTRDEAKITPDNGI